MTGRREIGVRGVVRVGMAAAIAVATLVPSAVAAEHAGRPAEVTASAGAAEGERLETGFPEPVLESLRTALGVYEEVRGDLAADRLDAVPAGAARLAGVLRAALDGDAELTEASSDLIAEAAEVAASMAELEDEKAARAAFGEVSRHVLLLADHDPRLVEGWQVFACPMAAGFEKWIQPTAELDNPYMGTAMPRCGTSSDWSVPEPAAALAAAGEAAPSPEEAEAQQASGAAPVFEPGIPGLRMVDVRDHKFLWREIEELQSWERSNRITVAEYRSKAIEKTAHYLGLTGAAADRFAAAASAAVSEMRQAFSRGPEPGGKPPDGDSFARTETHGVKSRFPSDLEAVAARFVSVLDEEEPRHRLFAPDGKKWLLRLAFGPKEAKEAREAREARNADQDRVDRVGQVGRPE